MESLLSHVDLDSHREVITDFYLNMFTNSEVFDRQEIIASLVTCVGSRISHQTDAGLSVLLQLTLKYGQSVDYFVVFIKTILDCLDGLTVNHIRILYEILSIIAIKPWITDVHNAEESSEFSELHMLVRKQLGNPDIRFQHFGIIGAVSLMVQLSPKDRGSAEGQERSECLFNTMIDACTKSGVISNSSRLP